MNSVYREGHLIQLKQKQVVYDHVINNLLLKKQLYNLFHR